MPQSMTLTLHKSVLVWSNAPIFRSYQLHITKLILEQDPRSNAIVIVEVEPPYLCHYYHKLFLILKTLSSLHTYLLACSVDG